MLTLFDLRIDLDEHHHHDDTATFSPPACSTWSALPSSSPTGSAAATMRSIDDWARILLGAGLLTGAMAVVIGLLFPIGGRVKSRRQCCSVSGFLFA